MRFDNVVIESPNWMRDNKSILYNSKGKIYTCDIATGEVCGVDIGGLENCNNDHALSFDGNKLALSVFEKGFYCSKIYVVDLRSGKTERITENAPSYLHGWSPDGKEMVYCACRKSRYDIYKANINAKTEIRLTDGRGFNDGCEFSPDGRHIWFNSTRDGLMHIWRMDRDGSNLTKMTCHDGFNSWFPHVSPNCDKVAYIAFRKEDILPSEHLPGLNVQMRVMNYDGTDDKVLLELYGGQGSFNTNSWSPDGKCFAYVRYTDRKTERKS